MVITSSRNSMEDGDFPGPNPPKALVGDKELVRTYYYNTAYDKHLFSEKAKSQMSFLDSLDRTPYLELRLGKLVPTPEGGLKEKGVEVMLAVDLLYHAARDHFDTAIVVTEDSDFAASLQLVKALRKRVAVALFPDSQTKDLITVADENISLERILDKHGSTIFPPDHENTHERMEAVQKALAR